MRLCLISPEHDLHGGLGAYVQQLARLLAREHEMTVIYTFEGGVPEASPDDPPGLRHVVADPSRLPPIAFSCDDHARSAAALQAIEDSYGDEPPDYLEVPDYRGHGLVSLQARNSGHRSLRGCTIAVRLMGALEAICAHDGTWRDPGNRILFDFEREVMRLADLVLWPGGGSASPSRRARSYRKAAAPPSQSTRVP